MRKNEGPFGEVPLEDLLEPGIFRGMFLNFSRDGRHYELLKEILRSNRDYIKKNDPKAYRRLRR